MMDETSGVLSRSDRVWAETGLAAWPELERDDAYEVERRRLRVQAGVLKGWTAWRLRDYAESANAFLAALDHEHRERELNEWVLRHLLEHADDYLPPPRSGCHPNRILRQDPDDPTRLREGFLASRVPANPYDPAHESALRLLHRLLLAEPNLLSEAAAVYSAYHAGVELNTGMVLAPIQHGEFTMGSPEDETDRDGDEGPQHEVTITHDFWIGIHPVTQAQYEQIAKTNPSEFKGAERPVEQVSWEEAKEYCAALTDMGRKAELLPTGYEFRLPTEAEWEYCCRAGSQTATAFGDDLGSAEANFNGNYPYGKAEKGVYLGETSHVGKYAPNAWGLYDMHGNVWEWCLDGRREYTDEPQTDPVGPMEEGRSPVSRGGSWYSYGRDCRSACRFAYAPGNRLNNLGFRVCLARSPGWSKS